MTKQQGVGLIEVLVALLVLSIGLLGLAGLQVAAVKGNGNANSRTKATLLSDEMAERMRANAAAVQGGDYLIASTASTSVVTPGIACANAPAPVCSDISGTAAAACTSTQMANYDQYIFACGSPFTNAANVREVGGVNNGLLNGDAAITCVDVDTTDGPDCTKGSTVTINITWDSKIPGDNALVSTLTFVP